MKQEQGFSLIELLIVVAIIAIIAAIAVPSMLTARMSANEAGAIQGCRTIGSAEMAYAAVNNQFFETDLSLLVDAGYLDSRFNGNFSGYGYDIGEVSQTSSDEGDDGTVFGFRATPTTGGSTGRYVYSIATDQVVRYEETLGGGAAPKCGTDDCQAGDPVGYQGS